MTGGEYWRLRWQVVFDLRDGAETHTVDTIAEIRALKAARIRNPDVIRERHWRVREWIGPEPAHVCKDGIAGWTRIDTAPCTCGTDHRRFKCQRCQIDVTLPEAVDGCGPLPWAPKEKG